MKCCTMKGISSGANSVRLERKSSIESEPQTLSLHQLHYAREAALYVLNNTTLEEAIKIFTEGLEPVLSIKSDMDDDGLSSLEEDQLNTSLLDGMRDIVTAPF